MGFSDNDSAFPGFPRARCDRAVDFRHDFRNVLTLRVHRENPSLILSEKYRSLYIHIKRKKKALNSWRSRLLGHSWARESCTCCRSLFETSVCLEIKVDRCVYIALSSSPIHGGSLADTYVRDTVNVSIGECSLRNSSGKLMWFPHIPGVVRDTESYQFAVIVIARAVTLSLP